MSSGEVRRVNDRVPSVTDLYTAQRGRVGCRGSAQGQLYNIEQTLLNQSGNMRRANYASRVGRGRDRACLAAKAVATPDLLTAEAPTGRQETVILTSDCFADYVMV
jgi:predicted ABC-type transport system involved in lysophospholipase L1 biosynthesis ATPase subunit